MAFKQFAMRNVLRNGKAYFAYFLSTLISVTLFFSLTTFILHPDKGAFKSYIQVSLWGAEMIAYLFLFFFVFYSVSVLLKKRYKEFGILYMLGTSRSQLLKMITIENMIISFAAAIGGIVTGLVFSKLFLIIIEKLLRLPSLPFYFPVKAILITLVCFLLLGLFVSLFTSWIVKEKDILRLLKATKAPKPAPRFSRLIAIFAFLLLLTGYVLSFVPLKENLDKLILIIIGMVVLATYFLFSQFSVYAIALLKKNRLYYLRNTNLIWVSNLFYRVRDNARMFFIITITSAAAVILSGTSFAFWMNTMNQIEDRYPLAFTYQSFGNPASDSASDEIRFIEEQLKRNHFPYEKIVVELKHLIQEDGTAVPVMKESVYQQFAKQLGLKTVSIGEQEAVKIVSSEEEGGIHRLAYEGKSIEIKEQISAKLLQDQSDAVYAVDDRLFDRMAATEGAQPQYAFQVKDWSGTYVVYDEYEKAYGDGQASLFLSKSHIYETEKRAYGTILFLSIFLGIIFLVASGSFIYNKFYMDQETDKRTYGQLYKIGVTFKEMKRVISIEIGALFLFPYIVATIHAAVAFIALQRIFKLEVGTAAVTVMSIFLLLQIGYFLLIRRNYLNVMKSI